MFRSNNQILHSRVAGLFDPDFRIIFQRIELTDKAVVVFVRYFKTGFDPFGVP